METDSLPLEVVSSTITGLLRMHHSGRSMQSIATIVGKRDTQLQGVMHWAVGMPDMHLGPLLCGDLGG